MTKKSKTDAAALEPADDAAIAAATGTADDAGAAGAGQAGEAAAAAETGADAVAQDAVPAGEGESTPDPVADAIDADQPDAEDADAPDYVHVPADYEEASALKPGDHVALAGDQTVTGIVDEIFAPGMVSVIWHDSGCASEQTLESLIFIPMPGREPPRNRMDINVLAAFSAASVAFGTTEEDNTTLPRFDRGWIVVDTDHRKPVQIAADFLRGSVTLMQPETCVIHLRRSGFADTPAAEGRVATAWKVFGFTLTELDALDRAAEEAEKRARAVEAARRGPAAMPRDQLAMVPPDPNPLTEMGRRLQRG